MRRLPTTAKEEPSFAATREKPMQQQGHRIAKNEKIKLFKKRKKGECEKGWKVRGWYIFF